jgi:hypothetical protein
MAFNICKMALRALIIKKRKKKSLKMWLLDYVSALEAVMNSLQELGSETPGVWISFMVAQLFLKKKGYYYSHVGIPVAMAVCKF